MAVKVVSTAYFSKEAKRFTKKYPSFPKDLLQLIIQLSNNPTMGDSLGANLYKVRLGLESKGGGKSGGLRVITYIITQTDAGLEVNLLTVYDKSEEASIAKKELLKLVDEIFGKPSPKNHQTNLKCTLKSNAPRLLKRKNRI